MGGMLDATNVLPPPLLCVICRIAIDHTEFLGTTITEITAHKAGIIKRGSRACVLALQQTEKVSSFIKEKCKEYQVPLYVCKREASQLSDDPDAMLVEYPHDGDQFLVS